MDPLFGPLRHPCGSPVPSVWNQGIAETVLALACEVGIGKQVFHFATGFDRHHQNVLERALLRVEQPPALAFCGQHRQAPVGSAVVDPVVSEEHVLAKQLLVRVRAIAPRLAREVSMFGPEGDSRSWNGVKVKQCVGCEIARPSPRCRCRM